MYFFVSDKKCCQICTYPVYLLVLTSAMKLKDANYKSHWTILVLFDQWKKMSDLNMSHEDMSDFVLFPLLGFTLVIKLRNFDFQSYWKILNIFLVNKKPMAGLNISFQTVADLV